MPNSVVLLDVARNQVRAELQLPLSELELAYGHEVNQHPQDLVARLGPELRRYILEHLHALTPDGRPWQVQVSDLEVESIEESASGPYHELVAQAVLAPPSGGPTRRFQLDYDVILHQVMNHSALVKVRQDWEAGIGGDSAVQVGVIAWDIPSNTIPSLQVNLAEGSLWMGFAGMVCHGLRHIAEGTDHMMFLLVLLLPAPLLASGGRRPKEWGGFGGTRYSLLRLVRIVTAFTVGHSVTLVLGAIGLLNLPSQPIEVLIALSILVSAIHAWRPLFPGREAWVAAGFGLIHGMAFAGTLLKLDLPPVQMALSILGFNLGIELMQLCIITVTMPWLILWSQVPTYRFLRGTGSVAAIIASLGWMIERITGMPNRITHILESLVPLAPYLLAGLILCGLGAWRQIRSKNVETPCRASPNEFEE